MLLALIPAKDAAKTIPEVVLRAKKHVGAVVVCDDGSTDMTGELSEALGAVVLRHPKNSGKGAAIRTLFEYASKGGAEAAVTLDADGQHDPDEIPLLLAQLKKDDADIVIGVRRAIPFRRKLGTAVFDRMTPSGTDTQSGFRAYSGRALQTLRPTEEGYGIDSQLLFQADEAGLKVESIPVSVSYEGETSQLNGWVHLVDVFSSILKHFAVRRPMTVFGVPGLGCLAGSAYFAIRSYLIYLQPRPSVEEEVLLSLVSTSLMMAGLLLLAVGLILLVLTSGRGIEPQPPRLNASLRLPLSPALGMGLVMSGFFIDALRAFFAVHIGVMLMSVFFLGFLLSFASLFGKVNIKVLVGLALLYYVSQYEYIVAQDFLVITITALGMLATPYLALIKR